MTEKDKAALDIVDRLKDACIGAPYAKVAWPHRLLHDAISEIETLRAALKPCPFCGCAPSFTEHYATEYIIGGVEVVCMNKKCCIYEHYINDFEWNTRATLAPAVVEPVSGAVPDGWKLVPIEPTELMEVMFAEKWFSKVRCIDDCDMRDCYDAMLASAPEPALEGTESAVEKAQGDEHGKDCCCAKAWEALGVTEYDGKSIYDHITDLRFKNQMLHKHIDEILTREPPADLSLDAIKKDAVIWYDKNFNKGVTMPTDREVMYRYIDYLASQSRISGVSKEGESDA